MSMNMDERGRNTDRDAVEEPDEFGGFDDYGDEDVSGGGQSHLLRASVWLLSIFIILILIAIPVLRAIDASNNAGDRDDALQAAREYVADQFATDSLGERATRAASQWTRPSLHDEVAEIVGFLRASDPELVMSSEVSHAPVSCASSEPPGAACFQAWLRQPNGPEIIRIEFAVAIFDGAATVVSLRRIAAI